MEPVTNGTPLGSARPAMECRTNGPKPLRGKVVRSPAQAADEAAQLRKAARDFESVFMAQVLRGMRDTVQKEELFHGGTGEDLFQGMLDDEIAKKMAGQGGLGIGDLLYRDLARRFHVGEADPPGAAGAVDPKTPKPLRLPEGARPGIPLPPGRRDAHIPLHPGNPAGAAAPGAVSPASRAPDLEAQVRRLRLQGLEVDGASLRR